jgi:hypothetical protein
MFEAREGVGILLWKYCTKLQRVWYDGITTQRLNDGQGSIAFMKCA